MKEKVEMASKINCMQEFKRCFSIIAILVFFVISVFSQQLQVESCLIAESDISAQIQYRKDLNEKNCALVKVGLGLQNAQFEGNIVGKVINKVGEYWVYMPQGSRMLKIKHMNYSPVMVTFANYGIEKLESNRTYQLTIKTSDNNQIYQQQTLTIKYAPSSAMVLIDSKLVKGSNGIVKTELPVGQHSYMVICDGYESEEGTVKLKSSSPSNLQITLSKDNTAFSQVTPTEAVIETPSSIANTKISSSVSSTNIATKPNTHTISLKNGVVIELIKVEAGNFTMGATSANEKPDENEKPAHEITLSQNYYIGKYEVTQEVWKAVMGNNPSKFKGNNLPVEMVSWKDCQKFIDKLNRITGEHFRLPSEAEWEYAARGGNKSNGYLYSGSDNLDEVAWYNENSGKRTHNVGTKKANELGIYDMSGNVMEWCQDWFGFYTVSSRINPTGPNTGTLRINRGGCWYSYPWYCRSLSRNKISPDDSYFNLGFRLALSE